MSHGADAGVKLAPHGVGSCVSLASSLHACRAAAGFATYEANRLLNPLRNEMGLHPWAMENGMLVAANLPSHGGEPDLAKLDSFLAEYFSKCRHRGRNLTGRSRDETKKAAISEGRPVRS